MTGPGVAEEGSGILREQMGEDGVLHLELNRPDKRNALNGELVAALTDALFWSARDPRVRVVVLSGAGDDFCSGADLSELERIAELGAEPSLEDARALAALFQAIRMHPRPVVAAVRGRALAGGAGLAAACDLIVADKGAVFGFPEVHLGFVPAMVMTYLRRKVPEGVAFQLSVRGERIQADEAHRLGLVNVILPGEDFLGEALAWSAVMAALPPSAVALTKDLFYGLDGMTVADGVARGAEVNTLARLTDACRTGVRAFLARSRSRSGPPRGEG